ncbi:unnamed protein product [Spirodela intermedia]|uniref:Uncharacterized protein n=1 Tax=Spirodela intermedia TaxID=51605 RepID=A0A7I8IJT0_SPIIN|nr:unnamed protein product [Spirodela intermedia]CAA6657398.1 unnamed protein product [Spirodela intermedia]
MVGPLGSVGICGLNPPLQLAFFTKSMTVCVIASTIPGISMNPILAIAQDTFF